MSDQVREDVRTLVVRAGRGALVSELEAAGLAIVGNRCQCPWVACVGHKSASKPAAIFEAEGKFRIKCHRCGEAGDLVDLLCATRGISQKEAIEHLSGRSDWVSPAAAKRREAAKPQPEYDDPKKLKPEALERIWKGMAERSEVGDEYLRTRAIAETPFVRYAHQGSKDTSGQAKGGWVVGMTTTDVTGAIRGIQLRLTRSARIGEPKIMSVKGSSTGSSFFGQPGLIEASDVIAVTEGMFDTLATRQWAPPGIPVVGAAGKGSLPKLAAELEGRGIGVSGKAFVLFVQNDRPLNASRREFARLADGLSRLGAVMVWVRVPPQYKDVADWLQEEPMTEWPPRELEAYLEGEAVAEAVAEDPEAVSDIQPAPSSMKLERAAQNFSTLCGILDDPAHKHAMVGDGEFWFDSSTGAEMFGRHPVQDADYLAIRLRVESIAKTSDDKPLKFSKRDIAEAITALCARKRVRPVKQWADALPEWDGVERIAEMPVRTSTASSVMAGIYWRKWMVGAMARALTPGCKMDVVLVLTGSQGSMKSTLLETLAGRKFFCDSMGDVSKPDAKRLMSQFWVVEWPELEQAQRKTVETVKSFLSGREDTYRMPYARNASTSQRTAVVVGTTNEDEFLDDPTGSRRMWPLRVEAEIDIAWVIREREQLWAEAKKAFLAREQHWLTPAENAMRSETSEQYEVSDPWLSGLAEWCEKNSAVGEVRSTELREQVLGLDALGNFTGAQGRRLTRCMKKLGWSIRRSNSVVTYARA